LFAPRGEEQRAVGLGRCFLTGIAVATVHAFGREAATREARLITFDGQHRSVFVCEHNTRRSSRAAKGGCEMAGLYTFMYCAVGGGLVATTLRVLEQYWVTLGSPVRQRPDANWFSMEGPYILAATKWHFASRISARSNRNIGRKASSRCRNHLLTPIPSNGSQNKVTMLSPPLMSLRAWRPGISLYRKDVVFLPFKHASLGSSVFQSYQTV